MRISFWPARRLLPALAVFLAGSALAFFLLFAQDVLHRWQGLASWQAGTPPMEQLRRHGGVAPQAQTALLTSLYPQGLIASLQASDWAVARHSFDVPPPVHAAALAPRGMRVATTDSIRVFDWQLPGPGLRAVLGAHRAAAAQAPSETGWGFAQVAFTGRGDELVALATRGRKALWWFGPQGARAPWPVDGASAHAADGLLAHEGAVVVWSAVGAGLRWLPEGATRSLELPHEDVAAATFTTDGTLVSASRTLLRRWRQGQRESDEDQPLKLNHNPMAVSDDGTLVMALHDERTLAVVEVPRGDSVPAAAPGAPNFQVSTRTSPAASSHLVSQGLPHMLLPHESAVTAVCACGGVVVTGAADGVLRVWRATGAVEPRPLREWAAYPGRVSLLACRGERLLSVGASGRAQHHALLWDLPGRAQPPEPHVVAPRVWPPSWHLRVLLASGLDAEASAARIEPLFDALEPLAAPLGVGVWTVTLLGAGWLARRRRG